MFIPRINLTSFCIISLNMKYSTGTTPNLIKQSTKNIVVIGTGAVGLLYGGRLLESELSNTNTNHHNHKKLNVQFLCRSDYNYISKHGFQIISPNGNFTYKEPTGITKFHQSIDTLSYKDEIDCIIISVKTYALKDKSFQDILKALISRNRNTKVIALMNGYGVEDMLGSFLPSECIYGGMAFVCCNRLIVPGTNKPVQVNHIAYGSLLLGHYLDDINCVSVVKSLWDDTVICNSVTVAANLLSSR